MIHRGSHLLCVICKHFLQALERNCPRPFKCRIVNAKWLEFYYLLLSRVPLGFIDLSLASTKHLAPVWWGCLYSTGHWSQNSLSIDFTRKMLWFISEVGSQWFTVLLGEKIGMIIVAVSKGLQVSQYFLSIHALQCRRSEAWQCRDDCVRSVSAFQDGSTRYPLCCNKRHATVLWNAIVCC